ncbi:MAG TPA: hypothetical protein VF874_12955 [Mycobacterium sp.]
MTVTGGQLSLHVSDHHGDAPVVPGAGMVAGGCVPGWLRWAGPAVLASAAALYLVV